MSFILDALKRAERERAQGQAPAAAQIIQPAAVPAPQRSRLLMGVLLGLCVLLGGTVATIVWLVQRQNEAPQTAAQPVASAPALAPAAAAPVAVLPPAPAVARSIPAPEDSAPAAAMPGEAAMEAPVESADSRPMATLDDLSDDEPPPASGPESDPEIVASSPPEPGPAMAPPRPQLERKPRSESRIESARTEDARAEPRTRAPAVEAPSRAAPRSVVSSPVIELPLQAPSAPQPVPAAAVAAASAGVTTAATPSRPAAAATAPLSNALRQMPEAYRAQFPQLNVDIHVYNEDPKRRFVMIAGRRYHEGEALAEGPRLIGIVPEGMVLEYQGQRVVYGNAR